VREEEEEEFASNGIWSKLPRPTKGRNVIELLLCNKFVLEKKLIGNLFLHSSNVVVSCRDICVLRNLFVFCSVVRSQRWQLRNTTANTEKKASRPST